MFVLNKNLQRCEINHTFAFMKRNVKKTRNNGTMTESAFWSFIRSTLRQKSRWWKPIIECKKEARRAYKGENKRQKWEYQCNNCKKWWKDTEVEVDHIIPAGTLKSGKDLEQFVENLFCEKEGFAVLCKKCHLEKTNKERNDKK